MSQSHNELVFNDSKTQAWIQFYNGAESLPWDSKKDALHGIHDCYHKQKITNEEFGLFSKLIIESSLTDSETDEFENILAFLLQLATEINLVVKAHVSTITIKNPTFEICHCKKEYLHGYIKNESTSVAQMIIFKIQGYVLVEALLEQEIITDKDATKLRVLIDMSPLPEAPIDPSLN